jgi:hypothetical protein
MKKKYYWLSFLIFIFISLVMWNCNTKKQGFGEDDEIYVFADSSDWVKYKEPLNSIFGQFIQTPIMEREFILIWKPFEKFSDYRNFKNIFILGRLDSEDPVSRNVRNLLNTEIIEGVKNGQYFYIPKIDVWAENQYVLFFVANSVNDMVQKIYDLGDLSYNDFTQYYYKRLRQQMFKRMEQKDLEEYIANHFPFTMRVQHDYFIANENLEENFVWIRRFDPDRSILIHWQPYSGEFQLTSRWIIDERNRLAKEVYSGDMVVEDETKAFITQFKRWNSIKLEGTWRNDSLMVGGPFRNYTFVDSTTQRLYMIDYYVQAIGKRKVPYLQQLKVIVFTFDVLKEPKGVEES